MQKIRETVSSVPKIILFGSHAYGTPNEDSEFDLCIVVEGVGARKRGVINRINWGIYDVMETPVDFLVYGPEEFLERASRTVTMEHKIALNGRTVPKTHNLLMLHKSCRKLDEESSLILEQCVQLNGYATDIRLSVF